MRKIKLDKIASATRNVQLGKEVTLSDEIVARAGMVVAVRAIGRKTTYNEIEDPQGRLVRVDEGDVIAGVLGERRALKGYAGRVPEKIKKGDVLNLLNMGGVVGEVTSVNIELLRRDRCQRAPQTLALAARMFPGSNDQLHRAHGISGMLDIRDPHQLDDSVAGADRRFLMVCRNKVFVSLVFKVGNAGNAKRADCSILCRCKGC